MKSTILAAFVAAALLPASAFAWGDWHPHSHSDWWTNSWHRDHNIVTPAPAPTPTPTPSSAPSPTPTPAPIPAPPVNGQSIALENVYATGYADGDNTPPGSPVTDLDGHHGTAGGDCSYNNPTTLAVGHVITNGNDKGDFAYGTEFYVPKLQCYFSAQDTCGDGNTPQNGPCHKPEEGSLQLDLYDGHSATENCESKMTGIYSVIENPLPGLPVKTGDICTGDTLRS